jgi:hypothetical protein
VTQSSPDSVEAMAALIRHHIAWNRFDVLEDGSVTIDAAGLELTLSEALANMNPVDVAATPSDGAIYAAVSQRDMTPEERVEMDALFAQAATPTDRCAKCGRETQGEAALVGDQTWCHPCADAAQPSSAAHSSPVTDEIVERAWAAIVGGDIAASCYNVSIIRRDLRTALEAVFTTEAASASLAPEQNK